MTSTATPAIAARAPSGERTVKKLVSGGGDVAQETVPDEDYYDYYSYYMVTSWLLP